MANFPELSQSKPNQGRNFSSGKRVSQQLTEPEECAIVRDRDDEFQIMRHVILLLALGCSMFVASSKTFYL